MIARGNNINAAGANTQDSTAACSWLDNSETLSQTLHVSLPTSSNVKRDSQDPSQTSLLLHLSGSYAHGAGVRRQDLHYLLRL